MAFLSCVGCQMSSTLLHTSRAYSGSVPVKLSGLYSKRMQPSAVSAYFLSAFAPVTAIFLICSGVFLKTCSRCTNEVGLYICTIAFFTPPRASNVRLMMCSRACVRTCIVTSSGIKFCSIRVLKKAYSVSEAAGNPASISLKPSLTSILKNSIFCSRFIGTARAWLPSRKSTLHHMGAWSMYSFLTHL